MYTPEHFTEIIDFQCHIYPQVPPKVEYSLSEKGKSMMPILSSLCKWGNENVPEDWILK